jgi:hypothetical protein
MRHVPVQCEDQRRPVLDDSNPRVAMTMDSPLMAFGQAEPPLKIEIVPDRLEFSRTDEKAAQEAEHQRGHLVANRIVMPLESID